MIIGTAGHIDHGKSALVEALTGQRMDPLEEERRRGITLDLHFASFALPDGRLAGVIDVPGHEDLIRTMVAGAAGLDLLLLVVAADEGIMPQTREHLAVVEQLRVPIGIPVITKADLVEPEWLAMVEAEVAQWLARSPVRFTPPVATSARSGAGIEALRLAIHRLALTVHPGGAPDDLARLPIDRAFSLPGAGTVVTGTAWSGSFALDDAVRLLPAGLEGRIRSLERHGARLARSTPRDRIAVGLAGVDRERAERGQVLVHRDAPWEVTRVLDVSLELLPAAPRPLVHQSRVRIHLGTLEVLARVQLRSPLTPGSTGQVRLVLEEPTVARGGDRLVVRSYSPVSVIGGGRVVDPSPPAGKAAWPEELASESAPDRLRALVARRPRGTRMDQLPLLLGIPPALVASLVSGLGLVTMGDVVVAAGLVAEAGHAAVGMVVDWQRAHPTDPGIPSETLRQGLARRGPAAEAALARLLKAGTLVAEGATIREASFRPSASGGEAMLDRLVAAVEAAGLSPPTVAELEADLRLRAVADALRLASRHGRVTAIERDRYAGREALRRFSAILAEVGAAGPITPGAIREATGLSRKFVIPLLEWADGCGLTIRRGDARVPGPKLVTGL